MCRILSSMTAHEIGRGKRWPVKTLENWIIKKLAFQCGSSRIFLSFDNWLSSSFFFWCRKRNLGMVSQLKKPMKSTVAVADRIQLHFEFKDREVLQSLWSSKPGICSLTEREKGKKKVQQKFMAWNLRCGQWLTQSEEGINNHHIITLINAFEV
jgi:hypothetical protein